MVTDIEKRPAFQNAGVYVVVDEKSGEYCGKHSWAGLTFLIMPFQQ